MPNFRDLAGEKVGKLTFIRFVGMKVKPTYQYAIWECRCECGNVINIRASSVTAGRQISCGCERVSAAKRGWDRRGRKHNLSEHPLYSTWEGIIRRCCKPHLKEYKNYGARGISVCTEWRSDPTMFINHMLEIGWKVGLTVDRIDNDGNYEPGNVRAANLYVQANNHRRNRLLTYHGETHTLAEWARLRGMSYGALQTRIQRGWSVDRSFNTTVRLRTANDALAGTTRKPDKAVSATSTTGK